MHGPQGRWTSDYEQPLVVPQLGQAWQLPARCMTTPHCMHSGASWLTEWVAYSPAVKAGLKLAENERIAGFVYVGTPTQKSDERERPDLAKIVTTW